MQAETKTKIALQARGLRIPDMKTPELKRADALPYHSTRYQVSRCVSRVFNGSGETYGRADRYQVKRAANCITRAAVPEFCVESTPFPDTPDGLFG